MGYRPWPGGDAGSAPLWAAGFSDEHATERDCCPDDSPEPWLHRPRLRTVGASSENPDFYRVLYLVGYF
jgi:hypothetical protein